MGLGLLLLAGAARAGVSPSREPLSARWIERPAVEPKGWTELLLRGDPSGVGSEIRYGLGPSVDLALGGAFTVDGLDAVRMSVRRSLYEREPRMTSLAVDLGWTEDVRGPGPGVPDAGLVIRQELAPFQLELAGRWNQPVTAAAAGWASGHAALTAEGGPLLVIASCEADSRATFTPALDVALQVSRGVTFGGGVTLDGDARALLGIWL